ncbi:MAG: AAA family ATPase [Pirellulales bacterium]
MSKLKKTTEEAYRDIVDGEAGALSKLQESLHNRLKDWYTPSAMLKLAWHVDGKSVTVNEPTARAALGEDNFVGEVARLGYGMQRSFIISMLHELAMLNALSGPTLLLGFEEPELYQHPPQAQHVAGVLEQLASDTKTNAQIMVSTHSPYFVSTKGFENVRVVRKHPEDKCPLVAQTTYVEVEASLAAALGAKPDLPSVTMTSIEQIMQPSQKELYFCKFAVLVEGPDGCRRLGSTPTSPQHRTNNVTRSSHVRPGSTGFYCISRYFTNSPYRTHLRTFSRERFFVNC